MSLLSDQLAVTPPPMHGIPCSVGAALGKLDPESATDLQAYLNGRSPGINDKMVSEALQSLGHRVGRAMIGRHRRRECRCFEGDE